MSVTTDMNIGIKKLWDSDLATGLTQHRITTFPMSDDVDFFIRNASALQECFGLANIWPASNGVDFDCSHVYLTG